MAFGVKTCDGKRIAKEKEKKKTLDTSLTEHDKQSQLFLHQVEENQHKWNSTQVFIPERFSGTTRSSWYLQTGTQEACVCTPGEPVGSEITCRNTLGCWEIPVFVLSLKAFTPLDKTWQWYTDFSKILVSWVFWGHTDSHNFYFSLTYSTFKYSIIMYDWS